MVSGFGFRRLRKPAEVCGFCARGDGGGAEGSQGRAQKPTLLPPLYHSFSDFEVEIGNFNVILTLDRRGWVFGWVKGVEKGGNILGNGSNARGAGEVDF